MRYDLLIIGNTPAGQQAALAAAALQKRVAILCDPYLEGSGTDLVSHPAFPFEILRQTLFDLPEVLEATRSDLRIRPTLNLNRARHQMTQILERDQRSLRELFRQHRISTFGGEVAFRSAHEVSVRRNADVVRTLHGDRILIACGTKPIRPAGIPFDGRRIFDANELLVLNRLPQ